MSEAGGALRRVFVVGCPRSGTTWTALLLSQHPQVASCPQTRFFLELRHLDSWWQSSCSGLFKRFGIGFAGGESGGDERGGTQLLSRDEFYRLCRGFAGPLFERIAGSKPEASVVVEQTPEHVRVAELILAVFPDAYFLHVIRDPRSVYSSLRSAAASWASEFPGNRVERAQLWSADVGIGRRIAGLTRRYHELRYEELLAAGPREIEKVFRWLDLPADAELCERAVAACTLASLKRNDRAPKGFFRRGSADGWRDELSSTEVQVVEYLGRDLMIELGYPLTLPANSRPPLSLLWHRARRHAIERLRHLGRHLRRRWG